MPLISRAVIDFSPPFANLVNSLMIFSFLALKASSSFLPFAFLVVSIPKAFIS